MALQHVDQIHLNMHQYLQGIKRHRRRQRIRLCQQPWVSRRKQFGLYDQLLVELRQEDQSSFMNIMKYARRDIQNSPLNNGSFPFSSSSDSEDMHYSSQSDEDSISWASGPTTRLRTPHQRNLIPGAWSQGPNLQDTQNVTASNIDRKKGKMQKNLIKHWINSPAGSVVWQDRMK
ncbi:unnamed protein product [Mytilus coruscus]|uniref:Uncharacterized protein n=1 Tax=Mytilus coruscus TaxID=42192 RepID=A0A6J8BHT1_MYTCO|nr:unnamed protein product [Mytilus coruscus]